MIGGRFAFPLTAVVHSPGDLVRLQRRAQRAGHANATAYVQHLVDVAAGITTRDDRIEELHAGGATIGQIATALSIPRLPVQKAHQRLHLTPNREAPRR